MALYKGSTLIAGIGLVDPSNYISSENNNIITNNEGLYATFSSEDELFSSEVTKLVDDSVATKDIDFTAKQGGQ